MNPMVQAPTSVQIIIGEDWKDNVRYLSDLRQERWSRSPLDLSEIQDIIDIVVDGNNLTAYISSESIFGLLFDLLQSLVDLSRGRSHKAIIEFPSEPWEMVLVPAGHQLLISLYSVDREHRVIAHDVPLDAHRFVDEVCQAADSILGDLLAISDDFVEDRFVHRFGALLQKLKRTDDFQFRSPPPNRSSSFGRHAGCTAQSAQLALCYEFDARYLPLHQYCGEHDFDLHALLTRGDISAEVGGHCVSLNTHYPFLALLSLIERTDELMSQLETLGHRSFAADQELYHARFDVTCSQRKWHIRAGSPDHLHDVLEADIDGQICTDTLIEFIEQLLEDFVNLNPRLQLNQRFNDAQETARDLRHRFSALHDNNVYHDAPERLLNEYGHLRPHRVSRIQTPAFPWDFEHVRALYPRIKWSHRAHQIYLKGITPTPHGLIVPTHQAVFSVDWTSGKEQWRYVSEAQERPSTFAITKNYVIIADEARPLRTLHLDDGQMQCLVPTSHRDFLILAAAEYPSEHTLIAVDVEGHSVAFNPKNDQVHWRTSLGDGPLVGVASHGPVLAMLSASGVFTALHPITGDILWRVRLTGQAELSPIVHQGRLYVVTHDAHFRHSAVYAVSPLTGRRLWQKRLEGTVTGPLSLIDEVMILPVENAGELQLLALDVENTDVKKLWQRNFKSAGLDRPTPALPVSDSDPRQALVQTDFGELISFDVRTGQIRWKQGEDGHRGPLFCNLPLIRIQDCFLSITDNLELRLLRDGSLVHRFEELVETPEFAVATGALSIILGEPSTHPEVQDTLLAVSFEHFLALVEPGSA